MVPPDSPDTMVECEVDPVVENVFAIDAYAVLGVVPYLQVAFSLVEREIVVEVVYAMEPDGKPLESMGGVTSAGLLTVMVTEAEVVVFPEESLAVAVRVCEPLIVVVVSQLME